MMSEEKFYQNIREQMFSYAPEVPERVYTGMRRKYAVGKFFQWNLSTFNAWYLSALVLISGATVFGWGAQEVTADRGLNNGFELMEFSTSTASVYAPALQAPACKEQKVCSNEGTCTTNIKKTCTAKDTPTPAIMENVITTPLSEESIQVTNVEAEEAVPQPIEEVQAPIETPIQKKKAKDRKLAVPVLKDNK